MMRFHASVYLSDHNFHPTERNLRGFLSPRVILAQLPTEVQEDNPKTGRQNYRKLFHPDESGRMMACTCRVVPPLLHLLLSSHTGCLAPLPPRLVPLGRTLRAVRAGLQNTSSRSPPSTTGLTRSPDPVLETHVGQGWMRRDMRAP